MTIELGAIAVLLPVAESLMVFTYLREILLTGMLVGNAHPTIAIFLNNLWWIEFGRSLLFDAAVALEMDFE